MPRLSTAARTLHSDRSWWSKTLIGGALWTIGIGWPLVEGFQLESIDNSQRGFPSPLPRWNLIGDKAILGIFALVIDFFFFLFPVLVGGMLFFCGTLTFGLSGNSTAAWLVTIFTLGPLALYLVSMWLLGVSAVAKYRYVEGGELAEVLSSSVVRGILQRPARAYYLQARVQSLPPYLLAAALLVAGMLLLGQTVVGALVAVWLGLSALFYARLLTVQLFVAAGRDIEQHRFEELRRRSET